MENRRSGSGDDNSSPEKNFNRENNYKKNDNNSSAQKIFPPRDNKFQPRGRNVAPNSSDKTLPRENHFQPRENNSRENNFQRHENNFQTRDNNFHPRDNRFQRPPERFQPRVSGSSGLQRREENPENRSNHFQPRKNFLPRAEKSAPTKQIEKPRIYDEMQVTDGKHIGKFLKSTASPKIRPTARRVRETIFNLVFRRVRAARFLDLCAGSGAVGIEAISRGALICTFVERSAKMCGFIKKNLEACDIKTGHGEVFEIEAVPFLKQMSKRRRQWDVVFFDPPYDTDYEEVLAYLSRGACIKPRGALVIEHHAEMFFPETLGVLKRWRVILMGETALSFYERK